MTPPRPVPVKAPDSVGSNMATSTASPSKMYCFASPKNGKNAAVIDLTGNSTPSPKGPSCPASPAKSSGIVRPINFAPATGAGGVKRFQVKNFKTKPKTDPKQFFRDTWGKIDAALTTIFAGGVKKFSYEELYGGVENVCRQDRAPELFRKVLARCTEEVLGPVKDGVVKAAETGANKDVLKAGVKSWGTWKEQMVGTHSRLLDVTC